MVLLMKEASLLDRAEEENEYANFQKNTTIFSERSSLELNSLLNAQKAIFEKYNLLLSTSANGFVIEPLVQFLQAQKMGAAIICAEYHESKTGTTISLNIEMNPMGKAFWGMAFIGTLVAEVGLLLATVKTSIDPKIYFDILVPLIILTLMQKTMFKYSWQRMVAALEEAMS